MEDEHEVVIVGAGICGLATAIALHKKGIKSVVMERSGTLRVTGVAIIVHENGWRALDQLGVANVLRYTAIPARNFRTLSLDDGKQEDVPINGEFRTVRRKNLIEALYDALPPDTVKFGFQLESIKLDPITTKPILQFTDGSSIMAKVVIGCDGVKSIIADFLNLNPTKLFSLWVMRGLTNYPNGHSVDHEFAIFRKDNISVGRTTMDDNLLYWFCVEPFVPRDKRIWDDPEVMRRSTLEMVSNYPQEIQEMVKNAKPETMSFTSLRYRAPWELLKGTFCKGTVVVAGDAMHAMGPFLGQGGSAGLEDAVVLARNMAELGFNHSESGRKLSVQGVEEAFHLFVKQRRMRVFRLSLQTYLLGMISEASSPFKKVMYVLLLLVIFRNKSGHVEYDCGSL